jgi:hypothetical protein
MTSRNCSTGVEIKSIVYTIQREGGCVHKVQRDPVDDVLTCSCAAGVYGRLCWAQKMVIAGTAPKPRVRATVRPSRRQPSEDAQYHALSLDV